MYEISENCLAKKANPIPHVLVALMDWLCWGMVKVQPRKGQWRQLLLPLVGKPFCPVMILDLLLKQMYLVCNICTMLQEKHYSLITESTLCRNCMIIWFNATNLYTLRFCIYCQIICHVSGKSWPITLGTGIGLGIGYANCQHTFQSQSPPHYKYGPPFWQMVISSSFFFFRMDAINEPSRKCHFRMKIKAQQKKKCRIQGSQSKI